MTIVGVTGVGKARGVSTVACGLASAAAQALGSSLLVESDPSGGDVGYWRKVDVENNSVIEATAALGVVDADGDRVEALARYSSHAGGSPNCSVLALRACGELEAQVRGFWDVAGPHLGVLAGPVVADFGRFDGGGVSGALWARYVDVGVVVANGDMASLKRLHHLARSVPVRNRFATVVVVNGSQWSLGEISGSVEAPADALLSWDPKAAQMIRVGGWKRARRSMLARELNDVWAMIRAGAEVAAAGDRGWGSSGGPV